MPASFDTQLSRLTKFAALPAASLTARLGTQACAYWLSADVLAVAQSAKSEHGAPRTFQLHASASAALKLTTVGVAGGDGRPLLLCADAAGLPAAVVARFPHLAGMTCLRLPPVGAESAACCAALGAELAATVGSVQHQTDAAAKLLRSQLALATFEADGSMTDCTGVQACARTNRGPSRNISTIRLYIYILYIYIS